MNFKNREELIFEKEHEMWKAASNRDDVAFKELVADNAIMICGGYRCLGVEYAEYIKDFYINGYEKMKRLFFQMKRLFRYIMLLMLKLNYQNQLI